MKGSSEPFKVAATFYARYAESLPEGPEREKYLRHQRHCQRMATLSPQGRHDEGLLIRDLLIEVIEDERRHPSPATISTRVRKVLERMEEDTMAESQTYPRRRLILGDGTVEPVIDGKRKRRPTKKQFNVVKALVEGAEKGERLTKDALAARSGCGDARGILKTLCKDPDWAQIIEFAGVTGGGYSIKL